MKNTGHPVGADAQLQSAGSVRSPCTQWTPIGNDVPASQTAQRSSLLVVGRRTALRHLRHHDVSASTLQMVVAVTPGHVVEAVEHQRSPARRSSMSAPSASGA